MSIPESTDYTYALADIDQYYLSVSETNQARLLMILDEDGHLIIVERRAKVSISEWEGTATSWRVPYGTVIDDLLAGLSAGGELSALLDGYLDAGDRDDRWSISVEINGWFDATIRGRSSQAWDINGWYEASGGVLGYHRIDLYLTDDEIRSIIEEEGIGSPDGDDVLAFDVDDVVAAAIEARDTALDDDGLGIDAEHDTALAYYAHGCSQSDADAALHAAEIVATTISGQRCTLIVFDRAADGQRMAALLSVFLPDGTGTVRRLIPARG